MDKLTPITNMPSNIEEILNRHDYIYALMHPEGFQKGIFMVIHNNVNYPQWNNIVIPFNESDEVITYTKNGWRRVKYEQIWRQLHNEYVNCFIYIRQNR